MTDRPNVILFTWHDAGDWFGCYGHGSVDTPHIDRLAAGGVRFGNNFSACAICSPSRAAIATGMYCQRNGVMTLTNSMFMNRIHPHTPHLAYRMKHELGYRTALFGVQHEAAHEHVSAVMDIDEQFATDPWPQADLTAPYVARWLHERQGDEQPFYAQIGTIDAHLNRCYSGEPARPDEAYPPVQDTSKGLTIPPYLHDDPAGRATVATLQGLLQRGDRLMGAVLDALDSSGLAETTIVCMCVDHGVGLPRAKTSCYDPGSKTAWIIRWPGQLPAGLVVDTLTTHVDVTPTLWDLLGQPPIPGLDGASLAAHARGTSQTAVHDAVYCHMVENTRSIRTTSHKLIRNFRPPRFVDRKASCAELHRGYDDPPASATACPQAALELYDLIDDPHELRNLADDPAHAERCRELDDRLFAFLHETDDFIIHEPVRSPWQLATRRAYDDWCRRSGRRPSLAEGPLVNAIDAASAVGQVAADW